MIVCFWVCLLLAIIAIVFWAFNKTGFRIIELVWGVVAVVAMAGFSYYVGDVRHKDALARIQVDEQILHGNFEVGSQGGSITIVGADGPEETILGQKVTVSPQPFILLSLEDARQLSKLMLADPSTYPNAKALVDQGR